MQLSIRNPNRDIAFFYDRFYLSVEYRGADVVKGQALTAAPLYQPPKTTSALAFQGVAASASRGLGPTRGRGGGFFPLPEDSRATLPRRFR